MDFDEFLKQTLPVLGYQWRPHRRRGVRRKIQDRLRKLHLCDYSSYKKYLLSSPQEQLELRKLLLITVSRFFRNHEYFDFLRQKIFPAFIEKKQRSSSSNRIIRIASLGCASGEEAYSIAMVWDYYLAKKFPDFDLHIVACDCDQEVLERAKKGIYQKSSLREVSPELLKRYFTNSNNKQGRFILKEACKSYVDFTECDILRDMPPGKFDIIFCCYTIFYYHDEATQKAFLTKLSSSIQPGGYLVIGKKEKLPEWSANEFFPDTSGLHFYRCTTETRFYPIR